MTSEYGLFSSNDIINLPKDGKKPIIDNLLYERENVLVLADSKVGKSILVQQMLFCISSGKPFLNLKSYENPCLYALFEGDKYDLQSNMVNMNMNKDIECKRENLYILYHFGITLNTDKGLAFFMTYIDKAIENGMPIPKVIVLDCLYMAFKGKLVDDDRASDFCRNVRQINDKYNTAVVVIHHTHRAKRDKEGTIIDEGDNSFYGAFLWKAFPNHILLLENLPGKGKRLTCNTQRMGKILEKIDMDFVQPTPLFFRAKGKYPWSMQNILDNIPKSGITHDELMSKASVSSATLYKVLGELMEVGEIEKIENVYPNKWKRNKEI
ncbi:hypothetical protein CCP1ISM_50033 [Azospirillaceae bacterium]